MRFIQLLNRHSLHNSHCHFIPLPLSSLTSSTAPTTPSPLTRPLPLLLLHSYAHFLLSLSSSSSTLFSYLVMTDQDYSPHSPSLSTAAALPALLQLQTARRTSRHRLLHCRLRRPNKWCDGWWVKGWEGRVEIGREMWCDGSTVMYNTTQHNTVQHNIQ